MLITNKEVNNCCIFLMVLYIPSLFSLSNCGNFKLPMIIIGACICSHDLLVILSRFVAHWLLQCFILCMIIVPFGICSGVLTSPDLGMMLSWLTGKSSRKSCICCTLPCRQCCECVRRLWAAWFWWTAPHTGKLMVTGSKNQAVCLDLWSF